MTMLQTFAQRTAKVHKYLDRQTDRQTDRHNARIVTHCLQYYRVLLCKTWGLRAKQQKICYNLNTVR